MAEEYNIPEGYTVVKPDLGDRIYDEVNYRGFPGLGISRVAFCCGFVGTLI